MTLARKPAVAPVPRSRSRFWPACVGVALPLALLVVVRTPSGSTGAYVAGALLAIMCAVPIVLWRRRRERGIPMFELVCLSYAVQYALPLYIEPNLLVVSSRPVLFTWAETLQPLLLVTAGVASMLAAYYVCKRLLSSVPRLNLPLDATANRRYICWGLLIGLAALAMSDLGMAPSGLSGLGAFFRIATDQTYVAIALLGLSVYRGELAGRWTVALYVVTITAAALGLVTGLLENALVPLTVLVVVYWRAAGRAPLRLVLVVILGFVLLDSVKGEYRSQVWYGGRQTSIGDQLGLWAGLSGTAVDHLFTSDAGLQLGTIAQHAGSRLDLLHTFMWVHTATPRVVPYFDGGTYSYLAYGWVPRFLWPGKPQAQTNTLNAVVDYGLLTPGSSSSIGLGQPAEAYANFGWSGVLIVLAIEGLFFAALDHVLNGPESQGGAAIYLAVMVFLLNGIGSHTATIFGSIIQDVACMVIVLTMVASSRRGRLGPSRPDRRASPVLSSRPAGRP